jgi:hypothetical protein
MYHLYLQARDIEAQSPNSKSEYIQGANAMIDEYERFGKEHTDVNLHLLFATIKQKYEQEKAKNNASAGQ